MKAHRKSSQSSHFPTRHLEDRRSELDSHPRIRELGSIIGSSTGEVDHEVLAGGWQGTDDATSTAPSDLAQSPSNAEDFPADTQFEGTETLGRASAGGLGTNVGGVTDLKGTPAEDSRNWTDDPIIEK